MSPSSGLSAVMVTARGPEVVILNSASLAAWPPCVAAYSNDFLTAVASTGVPSVNFMPGRS